MIISCDNCSVSLQLDEAKMPNGNFTVRCPRCQNLVRVQRSANGKSPSTVDQLKASKAAPAVPGSAPDFKAKESEFELNKAMKSLLSALQKDNVTKSVGDDDIDKKPRRVLLCLGDRKEEVSRVLVDEGYKVYAAQTPAQANERMRDGKTEILIFSPDFASEFGGAAILQQKVNAMYSSERRRLFLILVEENGATLNAHEAFLRNLNLIVNENDIEQMPLIMERALRDFNDLYYYYNKSAGVAAI